MEDARAADQAEQFYARPGLTIERMPPPRGIKDWARVLERRMAA